jgi:hypothetical protein
MTNLAKASAQDHSLGIDVALDLLPEFVGLLDAPAHGANREGDAACRDPRAGHARGAASARSSPHSPVPLEADRHGPSFEHVLQRGRKSLVSAATANT